MSEPTQEEMQAMIAKTQAKMKKRMDDDCAKGQHGFNTETTSKIISYLEFLKNIILW